jgi:hypothetical protein
MRLWILAIALAAGSAAADPLIVDTEKFFAYAREPATSNNTYGYAARGYFLLSQRPCPAADWKWFKDALIAVPGMADEPACWSVIRDKPDWLAVCPTYVHSDGKLHVRGHGWCKEVPKSIFLETKSLPKGARFK